MILYSQWLQLPIATRHAIAQAFHINKKNSTHVVDNYVRDDGYLIGDVETALTKEAMEAYTETKGTTELLWALVVSKAEGRDFLISQTIVSDAVVIPETKVETSPEKIELAVTDVVVDKTKRTRSLKNK